MRFSSAITVAAAAASANATTIQVAVGQNGLAYTPNDIQALVGDIVEFSFFPKNHSVTQSSFADPCHPLAGGFFSSFVPTAAGTTGSTFSITVNTTKPIWFYCGQTTGNHCQSGMVGSINAPTSGNTLVAFEGLAKNATLSSSPPGGAIGGILQLAATNATTSSTVEVKTVTATVTAVITTGSSTYTTTYPTTYPTTYTTAVSATGTSSSTTTTATPGAAAGLAVNGGMAGAVLVAALAML